MKQQKSMKTQSNDAAMRKVEEGKFRQLGQEDSIQDILNPDTSRVLI